jgi:hypothetical protein
MVWLLLWPGAESAFACTCARLKPPPCGALGGTEFVFVGEVLDITPTTFSVDGSVRSTAAGLLVRLRVLEMLSGPEREQVEVVTARDGMTCGYPFDRSRRYVVYAYRSRDGRLHTNVCSRTKPLSAGGEDLKFFRNTPVSTETRARVSGKAILRDGNDAFEGARIVLSDGTQRSTAVSRADGGYSVNLPPGSYDLTVEVPTGLYVQVPVSSIVIRDPRACVTRDVGVRYDGHIRGRVVTATGTPVPHLPLEIGPPRNVSGPSHWSTIYAVTDATGAFDIARVPPGRFVLAVSSAPRLLHPGTPKVDAARTFEMKPTALIDAGDFVLPPSVSVVEVRGQVIGADGRPRDGASVYLKLPTETAWTPSFPLQTDQDGRFVVSAIQGQRYVLYAFDAPVGMTQESERVNIIAVPDLQPVTLQMRAR